MTKAHATGLRALQITAGAGAALTFALVADAGAAVDLSTPQSAAGQWDLSLNDTPRKCRLMLRPDIAAAGFAVGIPATCRRALPILASVGAWTVPSAQHLNLDDAAGTAVLEFEPGASEALVATGPGGETYRLVVAQAIKPVPVAPGGTPALQPPPAAPPPGAAPKPGIAAKPPAAPALKIAEVAGRYNILRDGGKDSGCMLTLDEKAPGLKGLKAVLAPACRDQGMVIFDPAGWTLDKGRLVLTARKGHQTHLDLQPDGMWTKDAKEGKSLAIKKF